jgi:hypothetical protein
MKVLAYPSRYAAGEESLLRHAAKSDYFTVSVKLRGLTDAVDAVIVIVPAFDPVVYVTVACPATVVTAVVLENVPPAPLSVKFTVMPEMGLPYSSFNETTRLFCNLVLGFADWLFPETIAKVVGGPTTDFAVVSTLTLPSVPVAVMVFTVVGSV